MFTVVLRGARLGGVVSASSGRALEPADGRNENDGTVCALDHLGRGQLHEPVIRQDVVVEHFTELLIADGAKRTIVRVAGSITDQDIDGAESDIGLGDQLAQCLFGRDSSGNRDRSTVSVHARYLIDHGLTSFL